MERNGFIGILENLRILARSAAESKHGVLPILGKPCRHDELQIPRKSVESPIPHLKGRSEGKLVIPGVKECLKTRDLLADIDRLRENS